MILVKKKVEKHKIKEVKTNSAQIIIGKSGLSENILNTMKNRLKKDKIIKVKMLKTAPELGNMGRKDFARMIAIKLNSNLIEIRGYNLILQKKDSSNLKESNSLISNFKEN